MPPKRRGKYIMEKIVRKTIKPTDKPTPAQIKEIEIAAQSPIAFDEDCPELSYEEMLEMIEATNDRANNRRKEVVTLRLSPATIKKAKATGRGYTSFLSRLIENAINDKDMVARSL